MDVTGLSGYQSLNVSRIESVCTDINPEFGMHDGQLSSDSDSDASESSERSIYYHDHNVYNTLQIYNY